MLGHKGVFELISKYYDTESEVYRILVQHGSDVASLALEIAERYPGLELDRDFLWEASMLHDLGIILTEAPGLGCFGSKPYICHGYLGADLLRDAGLYSYANVAERHTGAGLTERDVQALDGLLPPRIYMPQTVEERVICYADKFYSKNKLRCRKSLQSVRHKLAKHGSEALVRFDLLHSEFAIE